MYDPKEQEWEGGELQEMEIHTLTPLQNAIEMNVKANDTKIIQVTFKCR